MGLFLFFMQVESLFYEWYRKLFKFVPELQSMYENMYKMVKKDSANQNNSNSKLICKIDIYFCFYKLL